MKQIVVATHNVHKVSEIRAILNLPDWEFVSLDELGITEEAVEDADTFVGNARIKARFAHERTGLAALADDSGLVVDALGGAPGVHSSRYAGEESDDTANNEKLLRELRGFDQKEREARFVCVLVFIDADGSEIVAEGEVAGRIGFEGRGSAGFGYDPLFCLEHYDYQRTMAELDAQEKNALSHRYEALQRLRETLFLDAADTALFEESPESVTALSYASTPATTSSLTAQTDSIQADEKHQIVAFDLDGTLIDASSPVRLISRLNRDRIMPKFAIFKSMLWGLRYKMGSELDQSKPRRYVFSSFKNFSVSDANAIMQNLYNEELTRFLRPQVLEQLRMHQAAGRTIILVSASFEPIVTACCKDLGIDAYICTQMEIKNGVYTGETQGRPPEGEQKLLQFTTWADTNLGKGNWILTHAYGDHFSDVPLMETALHPIVVDPDRRLESIAKDRNWEMHDWPLNKKENHA